MDRFRLARQSQLRLSQLHSNDRSQALRELARLLEKHRSRIFSANLKDLEEQKGKISPSLYQRLKFDESKLGPVLEGIRQLADASDPVGILDWARELDAGLVLEKRQVSIGVIGVIFESRPDVLPQILSLMIRTGNAVIFKGGAEAHHSQRAIMEVVGELTRTCSFFEEGWAQLLESRADVGEMLKQNKFVDLIIPRGSNELVKFVMSNTDIPVLGHAEGICHIYIHPTADLRLAAQVVKDSKAQYPSACNAVETVLVDQAVWPSFLPHLAQLSEDAQIRLICCERSHSDLQKQAAGLVVEAATAAAWSTEYSALTMNVKIVASLDEAIAHIQEYGSRHTDVILHQDPSASARFLSSVDSANVFSNCSTRFSDGFRYGFGAEVGISTGKLPPRGPVGMEGLMTYKYLLSGQGQLVETYSGPNAKPFTHKNLKIP